MSERKSPNQKASETRVGTVMKGNDKNFWIVKKVTGSKRWFPYRKAGEKEQIYYTHDNGSRPFKVRVVKKMVNIYKDTKIYNNPDADINAKLEYDTLVLSLVDYKKIFIGNDPKHRSFKGNSIVIEIIPNNYLYIGSEIYTFKTKDEIIDYKSPIGNNDVPYPYAIGTKNTYLMIENIYIPNDLKENEDPYAQYYTMRKQERNNHKRKYGIKKKMIQKRL